MKFLRASVLVAACAVTMASVKAEEVTVVAPVAHTVSAKAAAYCSQAKETAQALFANAVSGAQNSGKAVVSSMKQANSAVVAALKSANENVNAAVTTKVSWFKSHENALTASKVAVATVVAAGTTYMLKKAYDKVKAYRAVRA